MEQAGEVLPGAWRVWEKVAAKWLPLLCLGWGIHHSHPALPSSCNLTCPPGRYGANCASVCSCHDGACDPLTGACHMGECRGLGAGLCHRAGIQSGLPCRGQPEDGGDRGRGPPGAAAHPPALPALLLLRLPQEGRSQWVSAGTRRDLTRLGV